MAIVEEEADESGYWLEILIDAAIVKQELVADLLREAGELTAISVTSIRTSRRNEK